MVVIKFTIDLRKQLVDNSVVDTCVAADGASGLADGVNLVEYNDVKTAVRTALRETIIIYQL